jgi:hypothetical protein
MPSDIGTQTITVKFFDPVDSSVANRIGLDVRKLGIYSGGYLTKVDNTTVTLSPFTCEIGDGTYQVRGKTEDDVNITIAVATPYIVLRWIYTGSANDDYIDFKYLALGSILSTDIVVGKGVFSGSTLTGFDYTSRTNPDVQALFLKVEPPDAASTSQMKVRIRAGRVNYGAVNYDVLLQESPLLVAPGSNSYIGIVQVDRTGAVSVTYGSAAASPTAPDYGGLVTLAEITIASGCSAITAAMIKDVRAFIGSTLYIPLAIANGGTGSATKNFVDLTTAQSVAGVKTFSSSPIVPSPTTTYQPGTKGYIDALTAIDSATIIRSGGILQTGQYLAYKTVPRWRTKINFGVLYTTPSQFTSPETTGSIVSFGELMWELAHYSTNGSYLYEMRAYNASGSLKNVTQKLRFSDDDVYFYLNAGLVTSSPVAGAKNVTVTWGLVTGLNLLQIVLVENPAGGVGIQLLGDIINGTDVYYVPF